MYGKKAIITGANRSIGQAIAISLAIEGADVFISYRTDKMGAEKTVAAINKLGKKPRRFAQIFPMKKRFTIFLIAQLIV